METKKWYASRVVWFNVLAALVVAANLLGYEQFVPDTDVVALVTIVVNIVLRWLTKQGIEL